MKRLTIAATCLLAATAAQAQNACPLSYDIFEIGVPHTDMDTCPDSMAAEGTYCRLSLVAEVATIFAFSEETDCLVTSQAYYDDQFTLTIE
ncbi:hypothetical protein V8J85_16785 [Yoonia sp. 2307UL14-13]